MDLNELSREIYQNNVDKGFWETNRSIGEALALIHSEVSEALEDWRDGKMKIDLEYKGLGPTKPSGFPTELADIIIRTLDLAAKLDIDIERAVYLKHAYNLSRPRLHGRFR